MKNFTFVIAAMAALSASAQYTVDPSTSIVAEQKPTSVEYIVLADAAIEELKAAGAEITYVGPAAELGRNLWYWENTFSAGSESYPRVDMEEGGYISVVVGNVGWSGAGLAVSQSDAIDISMMNENTRFHIAYMSPTENGPASIALLLLDGNTSSPAKLSLGTPYNDNGVSYPSVGPSINGEWQGVDLSFADIKKLWPSFNPTNLNAWYGNLFSWLGGGVSGQTMAFDTLYFYNTDGESGVNSIETVDAKSFIVTNNTINLNNGNGIEIYSLSGRKVKSTAGCVLGINDLPKGIYLAKSGRLVRKIVVK